MSFGPDSTPSTSGKRPPQSSGIDPPSAKRKKTTKKPGAEPSAKTGSKLSHRKTRAASTAEPRPFPAPQRHNPDFLAGASLTEAAIYDLCIVELREIYQQRLADGLQLLQTRLVQASGVPCDLLQLLEYLQTNNMLGINDQQRLLSDQALKKAIRGYLPDRLADALFLLNRLQVRPPSRQDSQWQLRHITALFPELIDTVSAATTESLWETGEAVLSGNRSANIKLKLQLLKSASVLPLFIEVRLTQGVSIDQIFTELQQEHPEALTESQRTDPKLFFTQIANQFLDHPCQRLLLGQFQPEWFTLVDNEAKLRQWLVRAIEYRCSGVEPFEPFLRALIEHVRLPSDFPSWYSFLAAIPGLGVDGIELQSHPQSLARQALLKSRQKSRQARELLIMLACQGSTEALRLLANCCYEQRQQLSAVVTDFKRWQIPSQDIDGWTVHSLKRLMCRQHLMTTHPLKVNGNNRLQLPPGFTGAGKQLLTVTGVDRVLACQSVQQVSRVDESSIAGRGVFATKSFSEDEVVGQYQGAWVQKRPVLGPCATILEGQRGYSVPQHLEHMDLLVKMQPAPHFSAEKDTYVAWSNLRQTVDDDRQTYELVGKQGVELGVDGNDEGNNLRFLNHSRTPNVILCPAVNPEMIDWVDSRFRVYMKAEADPEKDMKLLVVACQDIDPECDPGELVFNYDPQLKAPIQFELVGANILSRPERFFTIDARGHVCLKDSLRPETPEPSEPDSEVSGSRSSEASMDISESETLVNRYYPGSETLPPEDVIAIYSGAKVERYRPDLSDPPIALRHFQNWPLERVVEKAKKGSRKALAYVAFVKMANEYKVNLVKGLLRSLRDKLKLPQSPLAIFQAIEDFIPMPEHQLMMFLSESALASDSEASAYPLKGLVKRYARHWLSLGKSSQQLVVRLKYMKVRYPPELSNPKDWKQDQLPVVLPGLKAFYDAIPNSRLPELQQGVANNDNQASDILINMARYGREQGLQHFMLGLCARKEKQMKPGKQMLLSELASDLNKRNIKIPPDSIANETGDGSWTGKAVTEYIAGFYHEVDLEDVTSTLILKALAVAGDQAALKKFIRKEIQKEPPSLSSLILQLSHLVKVPYEEESAWTIPVLARFIRENFQDEILFTRPLEVLYDNIDPEHHLHSSARIELVIRALLGQPGSFDLLLRCYREKLGLSSRQIAQNFNDYSLRTNPVYGGGWIQSLIDKELERIQ